MNEAVNGSSCSGVDHGVLMMILMLNLHLHRTVSNLMHARCWLGPRPKSGAASQHKEAVDGYDAGAPSSQASTAG